MNRSQGGDDIEANWLALDGDGTRGSHGAFTSKQRVWDDQRGTYIDPLVVASGIRQHMETERPEVLAYIVAVKGVDFLDRVYPRG